MPEWRWFCAIQAQNQRRIGMSELNGLVIHSIYFILVIVARLKGHSLTLQRLQK